MGEMFDGADLTTADEIRLTGQYLRVYSFVLDSKWHTLREISDACEGSEASVSARLRDLRKRRFGSHEVVKRRTLKPGVWEYRLIPPSVSNSEAYTRTVEMFREGDTVESKP